MTMLYGIKTYQELFTPEQCEELIHLDFPWEAARVGTDDSEEVVIDGKIAERKQIALNDQTNWLYARMAKFIEVSGHFGFEIETVGVPLKVQKYKEGAFHYWHTDIGNPRYSYRKLGFSVQLSAPNEYDGGDLQFFDPPEHTTAPKDQGCGILYPSYLPHQVTPVTRGARYCLTGWVTGPEFR